MPEARPLLFPPVSDHVWSLKSHYKASCNGESGSLMTSWSHRIKLFLKPICIFQLHERINSLLSVWSKSGFLLFTLRSTITYKVATMYLPGLAQKISEVSFGTLLPHCLDLSNLHVLIHHAPPPVLMRYNWLVMFSFRCTWWFDLCMFCKMSTISLVNVRHFRVTNYLFLWWELLTSTLLATFKYTELFIRVTILYISSELISLKTGSF